MRVLVVFVALFVYDSSLQAQRCKEEELWLASIEHRMQAVHEQVGPSMVRVGVGKDGRRHLGTGVIVTADGCVVTRCSTDSTVYQGAPLTVHLADGRRVRGIALGRSGEWKIGLVRITKTGPWPYAKLGNSADVKAGRLCVAMGFPLVPGLGYDRRPALVLGCVTKSAAPIWFTSSCIVTAGDFCGVFDLEGRLLGLTAREPWSGDPTHTSVGLIRRHWDDLLTDKNLDRIGLGSPREDTGESPGKEGPAWQAPAEKDRLSVAIEKAKPATVRIRLSDDNCWSGVIVSADGYIVTCAHCGQLPGQKVTVSLPNGRDVAGKALGTNWVSDIGLVKITEEGPWPYVERGRSATMRLDDPCVRLGYATEHRRRQPLVRRGRVVEENDRPWSHLLLTSTGPGQSGESGGGVFDLEGRVVAVHLGGENAETDVVRHGRVEMFRSQWGFLVAGRPVDVIPSEPLGEIRTVFHRLAKELRPIVVEVLGDGKQRALGTVVRSDGRILTKASELDGSLSCRFADGRILSATVEEVSRQHDLAVVRVNASHLPEADFSPPERISPGTLIAVLTPGRPPMLSVVSQSVRPISPERGWLGVSVWDDDRGLEVGEDSVARNFDLPLREADVIVHVEGHTTPDLKTFQKVMEPKAGAAIGYAGDPIRVRVKRGERMLEFRFPLPPRPYGHNDFMSDRCSAFLGVFDAYVPLTPRMCGGPVIDKRGRVCGIAIANRNRGWIYAIPAAMAKGLLTD